MDQVKTLRYQTTDEEYRRKLLEYQPWINSNLNIENIEDLVCLGSLMFDTKSWILDIESIFDNFTSGQNLSYESINTPSGFNSFYIKNWRSSDGKINWSQESDVAINPILLKHKDLSFPFVYVCFQSFIGFSEEIVHTTRILLHSNNVKEFLKFVEYQLTKDKIITAYPDASDVKLPVNGYDWSRVILSDDQILSIKNEFELFLDSDCEFGGRQWYKKMQIPYKRGMLFYGTPGNGKTSTARVMACHPKINAYSFDLMDQSATNNSISNLFRNASKSGPSLILMEDIDRAYQADSKTNISDGKLSQVSLQHFLNVMDGIESNEGVIVIATANDPSKLDSALLKRPGRFDSLIEFKNPEDKYIIEYIQKKDSTDLIEYNDILLIASKVRKNGFSFAQLQQVYYLAAMNAKKSNKNKLAYGDFLVGIDKVAQYVGNIHKYNKNNNVGF